MVVVVIKLGQRKIRKQRGKKKVLEQKFKGSKSFKPARGKGLCFLFGTKERERELSTVVTASGEKKEKGKKSLSKRRIDSPTSNELELGAS